MYWLLYDICSQRRRLKVVQLCEDYGMRRVQKSCFFGTMDLAKSREFQKKMSGLVEAEDSVCMIPVNKGLMAQIKMWGDGMAEFDAEDALLCFI